MKLHVIDTGFFKLDGGAMFGIVPKSIWQKTNPPDERNLCTWALRCLLIEDGKRLILIDNGIGRKQDDKFFSHYYLHGEHSLESSLKRTGFSPDDITDVFLTHLHFDHCGGGVKKDGDRLSLTFPNATYWSNEAHWNWATKPNPRERPSFLSDNILPMKESGHLKMIKPGVASPIPGMDIFFSSGHTSNMMIPMIQYNGNTICFVADLVPSVSHLPVSYLMSYDIQPLVAMEEKHQFLQTAMEKKHILFFEHDPFHECCTLVNTEKGVRLERTFPLSEIK